MVATYGVDAYGRMLQDSIRVEKCVEALRQTVKPGDVVIDIGTGTGFFALIACQLGARHVYAIEPSHVIQLARETAAENGYADQITFIQDISTRLSFPEQADVIFADIRGVLPLFRQIIPSVMDARTRLLKPGGVLIPQKDVMRVAVLETVELYDEFVTIWGDDLYGIDLRATRNVAANQWHKCKVDREQLLTEPEDVFTLDYMTVDGPHMRQDLNLTATRAGTGHGLVIWFDTILVDGVGFSNAPGEPELVYGRAYFPWLEPVNINEGDILRVEVQANLIGDQYVWTWNTKIYDQGRDDHLKISFQQTTFEGLALSPASLGKSAARSSGMLNPDGQVAKDILNLLDSEMTLEEIAQKVYAAHSDFLVSETDALTKVGQLAQYYID